MMLPPCPVVDTVTTQLMPLLASGDVVIDGGNSHYRDCQRHADTFSALGVELLDVGTNSGVSGGTEGYCLSVGSSQRTVTRLSPVVAPWPPVGTRE